LPSLRNGTEEQSHTVIVIPSYFDFLRLEKYLLDHNYNTTSISEYSSQSKVDIARNEFKNGESKILLFSERYHFFRRSVIKDINHLVFYGIPVYKECYVEMCNETKERVTGVYSRLEYLALERVVGTLKAERMVKGDKDAFMFS
jgi:U3 small nucleolar RNA-associated protein 25